MLGWLAKLAALLLVLGVLGFDGISVAATHVNQADVADRVALAASERWEATHNLQSAYQDAESEAADSGVRVLTRGFVGDPDGTVHLAVRGRARTIALRHIGPLKHWAVVVTHATARSVV